MLESLTKNLNSVLDKFRRSGRISESDLQEGLREVRRALLESLVTSRWQRRVL